MSFHVFFLFFLFFLDFASLAIQSSIRRVQSCKPLLNSSAWPSIDAWQALNASSSGRLLGQHPPAIVCDTSRPQYDKSICDRVGQQWLDSNFHSNDPVSLVYPNWQENACLPSRFVNGSGNRCDLRPFPNYVLNVTDASQVVEAVRFAGETGIRLVVKGGAHDLLGR